MEQTGRREGDVIEETCPACGVPRSRWLTEGVERGGTRWCCEGCADGTGCICAEKLARLAEQMAAEGRRRGD